MIVTTRSYVRHSDFNTAIREVEASYDRVWCATPQNLSSGTRKRDVALTWQACPVNGEEELTNRICDLLWHVAEIPGDVVNVAGLPDDH